MTILAPAFLGDPGTRWRECQHCGSTFGQPRGKRGRPSAFCSPRCRAAYGSHGEFRADRLGAGAGVVLVDHGERHNGVSTQGAALADLLGDIDDDSRGAVVTYNPDRGGDLFAEHLQTALERERRDAARTGEASVSDRYDLTGAADVGRTVIGRHVDRVIGQPDVTASWQADLDAAGAWLCDAPIRAL